jgi:sterol desaturase/sphingolipid hydroxylase (fatty acid hydroxylase superfamily)
MSHRRCLARSASRPPCRAPAAPAQIGIASETAHPLEFYLGNLVPLLAGPLLVRAHVFTLWVWLTVRIFETVDAHCGYDFPWSPARLTPWTNSTAAHDYHHAHNKGCYGSMFSVLDAWYGTDADFEAAIKAGKDAADAPAPAPATDAPPSPVARATRRQRAA